MKMNYPDEKTINKYLEGSCSENEIAQILEWIDASEENKKFLFNLKFLSADARFDKFSDTNHLNQAYNELMRFNNYKKEVEQQLIRKIKIKIYKYAATILLLISLSTGIFLTTKNQHPLTEKLLTISADSTETVRQITLEDGTKVWLAGNSRIEYPQKFSKESRSVKIEGRAYFEVTKDAQRPFLVDMGAYTVKVLGTCFEATNYAGMKQSDVILNEGAVEILNTKQEKVCALKPGYQFEMDKSDGHFHVNKVNSEFYTSWRKGVLEFDGIAFSEIAKVLERYYGIRIISDSSETMNQQFVGSLNLQKNISEVMKTIEAVIPIKYEIEVNTCVYINEKNNK